MKYCRYCGKPIDDDSSFCTHCGKNQDIKNSSNKTEKVGEIITQTKEVIFGLVHHIYSKIKMPKNNSSSVVWTNIKKWTKRISILLLVLILVGLMVWLGLWLFSLYETSKWKKQDERREAIAMNDISKAGNIARELFEEYAQNSHRSELNGSRCGFDHIERGIKIIRNAAEKGDARAQFILGCIYGGARYDLKNTVFWERTMMNTEIDYERAAYWFNQAAIQGYVSAIGNLASYYRYGSGVEKDLIKASELMRSAAEKGNAWAQLQFGDMYKNGEVYFKVEADSIEGGSYIIHEKSNIEKAKEWWTRALENGEEAARVRLEKLYE